MRSIYFVLLYTFFTSALSYTYLFRLHQQQCNIFISKFIEGCIASVNIFTPSSNDFFY